MGELERSGILASDAERERSVTLLREATVEGRLTLEEFSERVGRAQLARTQQELALIVRDLPAPSAGAGSGAWAVRHLALCSQLVRRGPWEIPARSSFRAIFGTIELDVSEARLAASAVDLHVFNFCGTVSVIVPDGIAVSVDGGGWFASELIELPEVPPIPDAPTLRIHVAGPGGTLHVRTRSSLRRPHAALGGGEA